MSAATARTTSIETKGQDMIKPPHRTCILLMALLVALSLQLQARQLPQLPPIPFVTFAPGDVLVSLEPGPVQWRTPTGLLRSTLAQTVTGTGEGMALDASGNLYVTRWCIDGPCATGNTVEKYNNLGQSLGKVGPVFNCAPHTILFAAPGTAYVGQAGCRKTILKTPLDSTITAEYTVAEEIFGVFWMDLGADGCTMYYTSFGPNVKRYDVCGNTQLANFNAAPLPGGAGQDLRVLPDGGVLVSSGQVIARLNGSGVVTQTYQVPGEGALWAGLDLVGDGTFWVGNYYTSNVYQFNLADGTRLASFNAGTPPNTVVGIRVVK
jgi:outer membrane protein assembly factor BamB